MIKPLSIMNDGQGLFDHYFDNRDMVTYEAFFAGIKFQPYLARITFTFGGRVLLGLIASVKI